MARYFLQRLFAVQSFLKKLPFAYLKFRPGIQKFLKNPWRRIGIV